MKYKFKTTEEKFKQGQKLVQKNGGTFYTDNTFEVSGVEGKYRFEDGVLTIVITDKPWLASWGMIESKLNEFFK